MSSAAAEVLVVDDDPSVRWALRNILEHEDMQVVEAPDGEVAVSAIRTQSERARGGFDAVILDWQLPKLTGEQVFHQAKEICSDLPIIILTGHGSVENAVEMVRAGAWSYLLKPIDEQKLVQTVREALRQRVRHTASVSVKLNESENERLYRMMGNSATIHDLAAEIARVASTEYSVLLVGETGVGKEIVAQAVFRQCQRVCKPFVSVDCGTIPSTLIESELFGHERGAFTGAHQTRRGKFELASGGTLFLDEIGNLSPDLQVKMLRVLEEGCFHRVGGERSIQADVRIITATNENLHTSATFRRDLYYRLAEYTIIVPPLRGRREDIAYLFALFKGEAERSVGKSVLEISLAAQEMLLVHQWPGNVRELRNTARGAVLRTDGVMDVQQLSLTSSSSACSSGGNLFDKAVLGQRSLTEIVRDSAAVREREILAEALTQTKGNMAKAARLLLVDYKTIHSKTHKYGLLGEEKAPIGARNAQTTLGPSISRKGRGR